MPTYVYRCRDCKEEIEEVIKSVDIDKPLKYPCRFCGEKGTMERLISRTSIGDPIRLGRVKPSSDFREKLQDIKNKNPGSTIKIR